MADGHLNKCKLCVKSRIKKHRKENDHVREYDRARAKQPHRKQLMQAQRIKWRKEHPDRYAAQTAVGNALRDGKLKKGVCEVCGGGLRVEAHHDDYAKPLEVRWLCSRHHSFVHYNIT